jgi:hypothetical protein
MILQTAVLAVVTPKNPEGINRRGHGGGAEVHGG